MFLAATLHGCLVLTCIEALQNRDTFTTGQLTVAPNSILSSQRLHCTLHSTCLLCLDAVQTCKGDLLTEFEGIIIVARTQLITTQVKTLSLILCTVLLLNCVVSSLTMHNTIDNYCSSKMSEYVNMVDAPECGFVSLPTKDTACMRPSLKSFSLILIQWAPVNLIPSGPGKIIPLSRIFLYPGHTFLLCQ